MQLFLVHKCSFQKLLIIITDGSLDGLTQPPVCGLARLELASYRKMMDVVFNCEKLPMIGPSRFCLRFAAYLRNAFVHTHIYIKLGKF